MNDPSLPRLYDRLAPWWPLLSHPDDYADEAAEYWRVIAAAAGGDASVRTVLELGAGGGNNAFHLKRRASLTLTDLAPAMLEVSGLLNPECEHIVADMRTARLGREFDAVFIHDAIMSMRSPRDLRAALLTAAVHLRPGGVALITPDCVAETFTPETSTGGRDDGHRGLRYLEWSFDPDPGDTEFTSEMVYLLRESDRVVVERDTLRYGLFARADWLSAARDAGLAAARIELSDGRDAFVGVRPS